MGYLAKTLEMHAACRGVNFIRKRPDLTLYVLVDVFGVNRSTVDNLLHRIQTYKASCELSYYTVNEETKQVLQATPVQVAGVAEYKLHNLRFTSILRKSRSVSREVPLYYDRPAIK